METEETAEIMEDVVVTTMMVLPPSSMMELATKRSGPYEEGTDMTQRLIQLQLLSALEKVTGKRKR